MDMYELQEWRRQRMGDAIKHFRTTGKGGAEGLGRALGYSAGAFLRQMADGKRPVHEGTIMQIEALPGMAGWFDPKWKNLVTENTAELTNKVSIPLMANAASMGTGETELQDDVFDGSITIAKPWIERHFNGTDHTRLRFLHAYGDSMAPTFNSGDVLLIDSATQDIKIDGIYALEAHGRLFIKRVRQRLDGRFEISSDNPTHKTVDTLNGDHEVRVKGRVIWVWNGKKI